MGKRGNLLQYRLFRRLVGSYVAILIVSIVTLSVVLFAFFSASATRALARNVGESLVRSARTTEIIRQQVITMSGHIASLPEVQAFLYANTIDRINEYHAILAINRMTAFNPSLLAVGLYNGGIRRYINNAGFLRSPRLGDPDGAFMEFAPRIVEAVDSPNQKERHLLTFVLTPRISFAIPPSGAIQIDIDPSAIVSAITSLAGSDPQATTYVLDTRGRVLLGRTPSEFLRDMGSVPWVRQVLGDGRTSGSFRLTIEGEKTFVAFAKSAEDGWLFISLRRFATMIGDIQRMRTLTLLAATLLFGAGLLGAWRISGVVYTPLRRVIDGMAAAGFPPLRGRVDEYAILSELRARYEEAAGRLRSTLQDSEVFMRRAALLGFARGGLDESLVPRDRLAAIQRELAAPIYRVVMLRFDRFGAPGFAHDAALLRFAAMGIAEEHFSRAAPCDAVSSAEDETIVVARLQDLLHGADGLALAAHGTNETLRDRFGVTVTCGIGDPAYSLEELRRSYRSASEYCRYRLFFGPGAVIEAEHIQKRLQKTTRYPADTEKQIIESLKTGNPAAWGRHLHRFIDEIGGLSYYQAMNHARQLLLSVFRHFEDVTELLDTDHRDYHELTRSLEDCISLQELAARIEDFGARISDLLDQRNQLPRFQRTMAVIADVKQLMTRRFTEPGLSLEIVADAVGLSSGYLGKLYKTVNGSSFSDDLARIRLQEACRLLETTTRPASEIAQSIGLYNITYFSTQFKKTYGMTPSQWRSRARRLPRVSE
jgi:two-component system, response regulator YesN